MPDTLDTQPARGWVLYDFVYRWVAQHRYCRQGACRITTAGNLKKEGTR